MAALTTTLLAVGTAAAVGGSAYSIYQGQKAAKYQKQAVEMQRQQAKLSEARQKRDAVRQARMAYAQAQSAAENQGVYSSSGASGGQGSIVSQVASNISFLDQYGIMSDQAQQALGKAVSYEASSRMASQVASAGFAVASNAPKIASSFDKIFATKGS